MTMFFVYKSHLMGHYGGMSESAAPSRLELAGLTDAERLLLAGELLDMVHSPMAPLSAEQITELEQRNADADAGLVQGIPWETVKADLQRRG